MKQLLPLFMMLNERKDDVPPEPTAPEVGNPPTPAFLPTSNAPATPAVDLELGQDLPPVQPQELVGALTQGGLDSSVGEPGSRRMK